MLLVRVAIDSLAVAEASRALGAGLPRADYSAGNRFRQTGKQYFPGMDADPMTENPSILFSHHVFGRPLPLASYTAVM
jgi:hypothetical protein